MKAVLKGACRAEGCCYARIVLDGAVAAESLEVVATLGDGGAAPCEWAVVDAGDDAVEFVVRAPLPERTTLHVCISSAEGAGDAAMVSVDGRRLKWESRVNYLVRKGASWRMREAADAANPHKVDLAFEDAVDAGGSVYLRGTARLPYCDDSSVGLTCLDRNGRALPVTPVVLTDDLLVTDERPARQLRYLRFSISMPANTGEFTLVAHDEAGQGASGFFTVISSFLADLRERGLPRVNDASRDGDYPAWLVAHRPDEAQLQCQRDASADMTTTFALVVDAVGAAPEDVAATVESVRAQTYGKCGIVVVGDAVATSAAGADVRVVTDADACLATEADFFAIATAGDVLEPDALFELACAIDESAAADALYGDADVLCDGTCTAPFFKPDFSIDLLRSYNYVGRFLCVSRSLASEVLSSGAGCGDAALAAYRRALRASELAGHVEHVPRVLCHERVDELGECGPFNRRAVGVGAGHTSDGCVEAVREHLERCGVAAAVAPGAWESVQQVRYPVQGEPLVSIVIPNRDCAPVLQECVRSILEKTSYGNYEVVIVENNSADAQTFACYDELKALDGRVSVVTWPGPFNFSGIVNFGVEHAGGDYILLLNNDTKVIGGDWLSIMLGLCQRGAVGAVGARLLYRDGAIQHAGALVTDMKSGAHHAFMGLPGALPGYYLQAEVTRGCSIVTAACMLTPRAVFDEVGGFNEDLTVAYNDVDYCLKVCRAGYAVVYEPAAELYHYESVSRGYDAMSLEKRVRLYREDSCIHYLWPDLYVKGDPFFNPNLESFFYRLKK